MFFGLCKKSVKRSSVCQEGFCLWLFDNYSLVCSLWKGCPSVVTSAIFGDRGCMFFVGNCLFQEGFVFECFKGKFRRY